MSSVLDSVFKDEEKKGGSVLDEVFAESNTTTTPSGSRAAAKQAEKPLEVKSPSDFAYLLEGAQRGVASLMPDAVLAMFAEGNVIDNWKKLQQDEVARIKAAEMAALERKAKGETPNMLDAIGQIVSPNTLPTAKEGIGIGDVPEPAPDDYWRRGLMMGGEFGASGAALPALVRGAALQAPKLSTMAGQGAASASLAPFSLTTGAVAAGVGGEEYRGAGELAGVFLGLPAAVAVDKSVTKSIDSLKTITNPELRAKAKAGVDVVQEKLVDKSMSDSVRAMIESSGGTFVDDLDNLYRGIKSIDPSLEPTVTAMFDKNPAVRTLLTSTAVTDPAYLGAQQKAIQDLLADVEKAIYANNGITDKVGAINKLADVTRNLQDPAVLQRRMIQSQTPKAVRAADEALKKRVVDLTSELNVAGSTDEVGKDLLDAWNKTVDGVKETARARYDVVLGKADKAGVGVSPEVARSVHDATSWLVSERYGIYTPKVIRDILDKHKPKQVSSQSLEFDPLSGMLNPASKTELKYDGIPLSDLHRIRVQLNMIDTRNPEMAALVKNTRGAIDGAIGSIDNKAILDEYLTTKQMYREEVGGINDLATTEKMSNGEWTARATYITKNRQSAREFLDTVGEENGIPVLEAAFKQSAYKAAYDSTKGTVDLARLTTFLRNRDVQEVLSLPQMAKVKEELLNGRAAVARLEDEVRSAETARNYYQRSVENDNFARIYGSSVEQFVRSSVSKLDLADKFVSSRQNMNKTLKRIHDPAIKAVLVEDVLKSGADARRLMLEEPRALVYNEMFTKEQIDSLIRQAEVYEQVKRSADEFSRLTPTFSTTTKTILEKNLGGVSETNIFSRFRNQFQSYATSIVELTSKALAGKRDEAFKQRMKTLLADWRKLEATAKMLQSENPELAQKGVDMLKQMYGNADVGGKLQRGAAKVSGALMEGASTRSGAVYSAATEDDDRREMRERLLEQEMVNSILMLK